MWIQIEDDQAKAALALVSSDPTVQYLKDRIQRYAGSNTAVAEKFRAAAMEHVSEGELEVDGSAVVSVGSDPGAYVMAWLWIGNEEAGFDPEVGSESLEVE